MTEIKTKAVKVRIKMNAQENLPGRVGIYKLNVTNLSRGTMYKINVQALSEKGGSTVSTVKATTKGLFLFLRVLIYVLIIV